MNHGFVRMVLAHRGASYMSLNDEQLLSRVCESLRYQGVADGPVFERDRESPRCDDR